MSIISLLAFFDELTLPFLIPWPLGLAVLVGVVGVGVGGGGGFWFTWYFRILVWVVGGFGVWVGVLSGGGVF